VRPSGRQAAQPIIVYQKWVAKPENPLTIRRLGRRNVGLSPETPETETSPERIPKRSGSGEWGDVRSASLSGTWRWSSVSAGQEAVQGRKEEAGPRRRGTSWREGMTVETLRRRRPLVGGSFILPPTNDGSRGRGWGANSAETNGGARGGIFAPEPPLLFSDSCGFGVRRCLSGQTSTLKPDELKKSPQLSAVGHRPNLRVASSASLRDLCG